jgi:thioredoxin-related protein
MKKVRPVRGLAGVALLCCVFLGGCGRNDRNDVWAEPVPEAAPAPSEAAWSEDFVSSVRAAQKENRPILLHFSGSDWSPPCERWKNRILDTPEFTSYAADNLVLIALDYPKNKEQMPEIVQQNQVLQTLFGVDDFPTLILLQPDGSEIERMSGVLPEGPRDFIAWLRRVPRS